MCQCIKDLISILKSFDKTVHGNKRRIKLHASEMYTMTKDSNESL